MADLNDDYSDSGYDNQASSLSGSLGAAMSYVSYYMDENDAKLIHCDVCHDDSEDAAFEDLSSHEHDHVHFRCLQCHAASLAPSEFIPFRIHCINCAMNV